MEMYDVISSVHRECIYTIAGVRAAAPEGMGVEGFARLPTPATALREGAQPPRCFKAQLPRGLGCGRGRLCAFLQSVHGVETLANDLFLSL